MTPHLSPLLTDLYQLTMMQAYHDSGMNDEAVFELFFRKLPPERSFLVACGLEQILDYLANLRFSPEDIDYLRADGRFHGRFLASLADFRFTGEVHAMAEGTILFPDEPVIRITAPLPQAQLVETRIINILQFQTMIASKAVRIRQAAPDKILVDYGLRRAHGAEAGIMAARAAYVAGFDGTATVLAGKQFTIPIYGTMAHSFIQAHDSEMEAFRHFALSHPQHAILLLDTYDTVQAAKKVVALAKELKDKNIRIRGVRLDSGDMVSLARKVRDILDEGGLQEVKIFASGNLDEYSLVPFAQANAPVDGFGIGTRMTTSADVPYFDCAYKLVEYKGLGRRKLSSGKTTWPGRKQVFRSHDPHGQMIGDTLALAGEDGDGEPLLHSCMAGGRMIGDLPSLAEAREHLRQQLASLTLPPADGGAGYPVTPSARLKALAAQVSERMRCAAR